MRFVDSDAAGNQFFAFEHSKSYQEVQKLFFAAVESMHPDGIVVREGEEDGGGNLVQLFDPT